jgi:hypothetical protein
LKTVFTLLDEIEHIHPNEVRNAPEEMRAWYALGYNKCVDKVDAAMAERVRLSNEALAQRTWPLEIDGGDADALIRMMQAAKAKAIESGECGPWFDDMIERIRATVPEGDGRDD